MWGMLRTLLAVVAGAAAALLWTEQRQSPPRPSATPSAAPEPERVEVPVAVRVEVPVEVADPTQAARILALESELAAQRTLRAPEPSEPPPSVDAIRAARARAFRLEQELARQAGDPPIRWSDADPPALDRLVDAAAEQLPLVAVRVPETDVEPAALWRVLGAMQDFAEACGGDWFEFHGDFARWCAESGHPSSLPIEQLGFDQARPTFEVDRRVNRSGQMVAPSYVQLETQRCYYIDDVAGETGRMQVVGIR